MNQPFPDTTTFVVVHYRGNIPIRATRLDNPTAAELLTEQMCHAYGSFAPTIQTFSGEFAEKLHSMLGRALRGDSEPTETKRPSWKGLSVLSGGAVYSPGHPAAREALLAFRNDGAESGVMVSHPQCGWRAERHIKPTDIDWTDFDEA